MLVVQIKLYPNQQQLLAIRNHIDANRFIYNYCLDYRIKLYESSKEHISKYGLIKLITSIRELEEYYWIRGINVSTLQQSIIRMDKAFEGFFRRVKQGGQPGFPKFKSKRASEQSFTYPQYFKFSQDGTKLILPNIGKVRCRGYRDIPGKLKQCVVKVYSDGTIVANIYVDNENQVSANTNFDSVGIDVGTRKFLTDSTGRQVQPFDYSDIITKIKYQQARLARAKKCSSNRERTRALLAKYYRKLSNQRLYNLHKLANEYAKYRNVYVEDLNIRAMTASTVGTVDDPNIDSACKSRLNNLIVNQSWGIFFILLDYKLKARMSMLVKVEPQYTSQTCSVCGCINKLNRNGEHFKCINCGHESDADHNASKNILQRGYNTKRIEPANGMSWTIVA